MSLIPFTRRPCEGPACRNAGVYRPDFEAHLCNTHAGLPSYSRPFLGVVRTLRVTAELLALSPLVVCLAVACLIERWRS